jgi:hypothetical protein
MTTLHWIFTNGHRWYKQFDTVEAAQAGAHQLGLYEAPSVDRAWIETDSEDIWLKEKAQA